MPACETRTVGHLLFWLDYKMRAKLDMKAFVAAEEKDYAYDGNEDSSADTNFSENEAIPEATV